MYKMFSYFRMSINQFFSSLHRLTMNSVHKWEVAINYQPITHHLVQHGSHLQMSKYLIKLIGEHKDMLHQSKIKDSVDHVGHSAR